MSNWRKQLEKRLAAHMQIKPEQLFWHTLKATDAHTYKVEGHVMLGPPTMPGGLWKSSYAFSLTIPTRVLDA